MSGGHKSDLAEREEPFERSAKIYFWRLRAMGSLFPPQHLFSI
jgi:hypothetical protein